MHTPNIAASQKKADAKVEAARLRLFGSAEDAVAALEQLIGEGTADQVRLNAAKDVLDRVGIKTATEVRVEVTDARDPSDMVRERLARLGNIASREITSAERDHAADETVDAEVLEEPDVAHLPAL